MLHSMEISKRNRIIRNLALACTDSLTKLNNHGYRWIHTKSGFIAHYNLVGFKQAHGVKTTLKDAILANQEANTRVLRRSDDPDYAYYKQSAEMYTELCMILEGSAQIPQESACFNPPKILDSITSYHHKGLVKQYAERFNTYLKQTHFAISDENRGWDLAQAAALIQEEMLSGSIYYEPDCGWHDPDGIFNKEFEFRSGIQATVSELVNSYHNSVWDIMDELIGFSYKTEHEEETV